MFKNSADLLRLRLRSLREAIPVAERQQLSQQLCIKLQHWFETRHASRIEVGQSAPEIVAGFWPLAEEPDLRALFQYLHTQGMLVALPLMVKKNHPLEFHIWRPNDPLIPGNFGVMEPVRAASAASAASSASSASAASNAFGTLSAFGASLMPTVLLVPTLGFTEQCARIGYGGGYYDRTLAQLSQTGQPFTTIGIAWDQGRLHHDEGHQPAPHDYPLDAVLTPTGWTPKAPCA